MLKIFTQISRFIIGIVFIYSGFVKMVDPKGTKIKMLEYFAVKFFEGSFAEFNLDFLTPVVMPISILLLLGELVLGIMIFVGYKPKISVWATFALTSVFLFLTWYSDAYQVVTDCGCFGDAIKLSTGETFYKNVFFMGLIIILIIGMKHIKPLINERFATLVTFTSIGFSGILMYYVLNHLPIIDYRAYQVGTNIEKGMNEIKEGKDFPDIVDFMIETPKGDQLPTVLKEDKVMLIFYMFEAFDDDGQPTISETSKTKAFPALSEMTKKAKEKGYKIYVVTDTPVEYLPKTPEVLGLEFGLPYTFAACDGKAMKTAIRANPGIMTIEKGNIVGKWNWTDTEDVEIK